MDDVWWERPMATLCNTWPFILVLIVLAITAYFTRDYWLPALMTALGI